MMEKEFNLLKEDWIAVLDNTGETNEVSLIKVFQSAHKIKRLSGELVAQDIAVLRLLLAVLYSVFTRTGLSGENTSLKSEKQAIDRWNDIWKQKAFAIKPIEDYLLSYTERFYLFHTLLPFYQIPLKDNYGSEFTTAKLKGDLSESGNKPNPFGMRSGPSKKGIKYSEAARWLLYLNGFDDISVAPALRKDLGKSWLGKLGLLYVEGGSLFETLMLNLSFLGERFKTGTAVWEKGICVKDRAKITAPANPAEMLSLQSRRISLIKNNGLVTGYKLYGGDLFSKENAFIEHMTLWKKKNKSENIFVPKTHNASLPLWCDLPSITAEYVGAKRPGVIEWIGKLKDAGLFDGKIKLHSADVKYKFPIASSVIDITDDSITFDTLLLTAAGETWVNHINDQLKETQTYVNCLGLLIKYLQKAAGGENPASIEAAWQQAYFELDEPFRNWLENIDFHKDDVEVTMTTWSKQAKEIVKKIGGSYYANAGEKAQIGRYVTENRKTSYVSASSAYSFFLRSVLNKEQV